MKIKVTQEHINLGRPNSAKHCAVSRAVRKALGEETHIVETTVFAVTVQQARQNAQATKKRYLVQPELRDWILRFDARCPDLPEPVTIELDPKSETARIAEQPD